MTPTSHPKHHYKTPDPKAQPKAESAPRPDPIQVVEAGSQPGEDVATEPSTPVGLKATPAEVDAIDAVPLLVALGRAQTEPPSVVESAGPRPRKESGEKSRPFTIMLTPAQYRRLARHAAIEETTISALLGELTEKEGFKERLRLALSRAVAENEADD